MLHQSDRDTLARGIALLTVIERGGVILDAAERLALKRLLKSYMFVGPDATRALAKIRGEE